MNNDLVIVCVGSASVNGDSLGPLVGKFLIEKYHIPTYVYGTPTRPITNSNIDEFNNFIAKVHPNNLVLAVDASISAKNSIGHILVEPNPLVAGAVTNKHKKIGDVCIKGVVSSDYKNPIFSLMNTDFEKVETLANNIAELIFVTNFYFHSSLRAQNYC